MRSAVHIGDGRDARVCLHLNYDSAWAVADAFPHPDRAGIEMIEAIQEAWPKRCHDEGCCDPKTCQYCPDSLTEAVDPGKI